MNLWFFVWAPDIYGQQQKRQWRHRWRRFVSRNPSFDKNYVEIYFRCIIVFRLLLPKAPQPKHWISHKDLNNRFIQWNYCMRCIFKRSLVRLFIIWIRFGDHGWMLPRSGRVDLSFFCFFVSFITIKRIILVKMNCVPAINWARTSLSWALTHFWFNAIWLHFVERETRNSTRKSRNQKLFYVWKILSKLRSWVGCVCSHCEVRPKQ